MMGYNQCQCSLSPCQWGIIYSNLINAAPAYASFCDKETSPLTISTGNNVTWNHFKIVNNEKVIIESGATLTITCEVRMVEDSRFEIEKGGKLIINGGHITKLCDENWGAIFVHGDPNLSQTATNQGTLELTDATIEFANNAVSLSNSGGGIIKATNTVFRNNKRSAEFINYPGYDNVSFFNGCTFTLDDDYQLSGHSGQITMWKVRGVEIQNCTFENNVTSMSDRGNAIYTIDAGYSVTDGSSFHGFKAGVYGTSGSTTRTFLVDDATFTSNALGVYAGSVDNIQVTRCTMEVGQYRVYPTYNPGIFIDHSTGYTIQENVMTGHGLTSSPKPVGILCLDTGDDHNLIRKNTFTNLYIANKADGDNKDSDNIYKGLEYQCNQNFQDNSQDDYDFHVLLDYNYDPALSGIRYLQGTYTMPAANTFSLDATPSGSDFRNATTENIRYYYYTGDPDQNPLNVFQVDKYSTPYSNGCESVLSSMMVVQSDLPELESTYSSQQKSLTEKETTYVAKMDGGDTEGLIAEVQAVSKSEAAGLQSRLMDLAPWVSAEVFMALFDRPDLLPTQALTHLLKANPDALSHHPLVEKARNHLPADKLEETLSHAREQITERTRLEMEMAEHIAAISTTAKRALRFHLNEQEQTDLAAVRTWLERKNSVVASYGQFDAWIHEGKADEAMALLKSIPEKFSLDARQQDHYKAFERLAGLKAKLVRDGRYWNELNQAEIALLEDIAGKDIGRAGTQAKGILNFFYDGSYVTYQLPVTEEAAFREENRSTSASPVETKEQPAEQPVKAVPNPASGLVLFQYQLPGETATATALEITDINGRLIRRFELNDRLGTVEWNSRTVQPSVYLYRWVNQGQVLMVDRLIITR